MKAFSLFLILAAVSFTVLTIYGVYAVLEFTRVVIETMLVGG